MRFPAPSSIAFILVLLMGFGLGSLGQGEEPAAKAALDATTPEGMFALVANDIEAGHTEEALRFFGSSESNVEVFRHTAADKGQRKQFADMLRKAKFVKKQNDDGTYLIYSVPFGEDGETIDRKLGVQKAADGTWHVVFW